MIMKKSSPIWKIIDNTPLFKSQLHFPAQNNRTCTKLTLRGSHTLCVWFEEKKPWNFNCRSCAVIRPTLPLELAWQQDWWQISVVMFRRKDSFPSNSFQFSMSALILSMYYDFRITWDWDSLFQSSTNPRVSNSPPLLLSPSNLLPLLALAM